MKRTAAALCAGILLAAGIGCGALSPAEELPVVVPITPVASEIAVEVPQTPTPAPTEVPTPSPTPEPEGEQAFALADGVGIVYTLLLRDSVLEITGERDGFYTALLDTVPILLEKRTVRLASEPAFEPWNGYARRNTEVFTGPYLTGEPVATLAQNTGVTVTDALGTVLLIEWDGNRGCVAAAQISAKKITSGGGGGGGGSDGGDIQLSARGGARTVRLGLRHEGEAFPLMGTVRADGVEAYLALLARGEQVKVIGEDETAYTVLLGALTGTVERRLLQRESAAAYEPWPAFADSKAPMYPDHRMLGEAEPLQRNAALTVLADLGVCYLVQAGDTTGYIPTDRLSVEKYSGGGGGGGGEWTEPVL